MKGKAILLTKNSVNAVVEGLPFRGKSLFAWAALNVPNSGQRWYYVTVNPANPGIVDYSMQIVGEEILENLFDFDKPEKFEFWFPVVLRGKR